MPSSRKQAAPARVERSLAFLHQGNGCGLLHPLQGGIPHGGSVGRGRPGGSRRLCGHARWRLVDGCAGWVCLLQTRAASRVERGAGRSGARCVRGSCGILFTHLHRRGGAGAPYGSRLWCSVAMGRYQHPGIQGTGSGVSAGERGYALFAFL